MKLQLLLAGLRWAFALRRSVPVEPELRPFLTEESPEDILVTVSWDWDRFPQPNTPPVGDDLLLTYYQEGRRRFCMTKGGKDGFVAGCVYTDARTEIFCAVNAKKYSLPTLSLGGLLRFLPMREIFLRFGVLFLHASQISCRGSGVLFTAPSGTGKTTQAKLWQKYRGAEIVCNDRTLLRKTDGAWRTYGYPLDGSEPVGSSGVNTLGAVVLLAQGPVNEVRPLRPGKAAGLLMRQVVLDGWSGEARTAAMELLLTLLEDIPVCLLTCTPDERAVAALERKLTEDGVIPFPTV